MECPNEKVKLMKIHGSKHSKFKLTCIKSDDGHSEDMYVEEEEEKYKEKTLESSSKALTRFSSL